MLTPQQVAFVEELKSSSTNLILEALAGTGKTYTMVEGVKALPSTLSVTACAFNKKIATELQTRMPAHVWSRTLNSLGHSAVAGLLGKRQLQVDSGKVFKVVDELGYSNSFPTLTRIVGLAKAHGIVPKGSIGEPTGLLPDTDETWQDMIEEADMDNGEEVLPLTIAARNVLRESTKQAFGGVLDFDDQLYISALWGAPLRKADVVLIDEAQDISPIQRRMLARMAVRLVAVGDRHQAIYGFRGADHSSMSNIKRDFDAKPLPLTISFRCPKEVVRAAQAYVPEFEAHAAAAQGHVADLPSWTTSTFSPQDAIVCRNNAPIVRLAMSFIAARIPVVVLGRDFGTGLKRLVNKTKAETLDQLYVRLEDWLATETQKWTIRGKPGKAASCADRVDTILALSDGGSIQDLITNIDRIFSDKQAAVTLCTIHKAKGLEWNRVFWLDPELIPSKYATSKGAKLQEHNLAYVAITRAKKELYYIRSERNGSRKSS